MVNITLLVPKKGIEELTEPEQEAEVASIEAGICIPNATEFGHLHIGAPLHGETRVPVHQFDGSDTMVRWEMSVADAAAICVEIPQENWDKPHHDE